MIALWYSTVSESSTISITAHQFFKISSIQHSYLRPLRLLIVLYILYVHFRSLSFELLLFVVLFSFQLSLLLIVVYVNLPQLLFGHSVLFVVFMIVLILLAVVLVRFAVLVLRLALDLLLLE